MEDQERDGRIVERLDCESWLKEVKVIEQLEEDPFLRGVEVVEEFVGEAIDGFQNPVTWFKWLFKSLRWLWRKW